MLGGYVMEEWTAYYVNNPNDDYNLVVEILHGESEFAWIFKEEGSLKLKFYAHGEDVTIPGDWLIGLLNDAKLRLVSNTK
jgi:hypothetical protein